MSQYQNKLDRYIRTIPKAFKPGENPIITAFLKAFSTTDGEVAQQIENTKAQLFVRTAEGTNLDKLANSLGVSRPVELGLDDSKFQELIPNLSLKPKQIRKSFYDTADVFWGPLFSRANVTSNNAALYNIVVGDEFKLRVDGRAEQTVKVLASDILNPGNATAEEVQLILNKFEGLTVSIIEDALTGDEVLNIRTNTPGPQGSIEILPSSGFGIGKVDFDTVKTILLNQDQRVMIYEIRPNEVIVEIPAIVPALRRILTGSHHFHADSTLESPIAPENGIWEGSFFYDVSGSQLSFTVTSQNAITEELVIKNNIKTSVIVDDTSKIIEPFGLLVFGWGTERQEQPVRYRGIPNSKTVLIDPSYLFKFDHPIGEYINVLSATTPYIPRKAGQDLPIYMTSPAGARAAVEQILRSLAAAGVIVNFIILKPSYKYLIDNPYVSDDDAPSI
ncbi:MAG: hypothetical protein MOGMAGMI_00392 [Candidatus Omnitrophica bacterium]|nr:hypothetical protein [Candidatus Omnitrophota bacterium]